MPKTFKDIIELPLEERKKLFFKMAKKTKLVEDRKYISGIPKGTEEDINLFYLLEDILEYPKPQMINKKYL